MNYFNESPDNQRIRKGDVCVVYISEHQRYIIKIEPDVQLQTKFGLIKALDLLGCPYGIRYECKKGWVIPLRLTPEMWTQLLPHRTQILYQADISLILLQLDIKPGSIVVESGTGSGSLSHAIIRACLPTGHLYTFDIDESRVQVARREFEDHGFGKNVTVTQRNICELGYGDELEGKVDACVLDLPQTWTAIEHAHRVMREDGSKLVTFSPCIEQVQQNVAKMTELKFKDIVTMECLLRPFEVKEQRLRLWNEDILDGLIIVDRRRIENIKSHLNPAKRSKISDDFKEVCESATIEDSEIKLDPSTIGELNSKLLRKALEDPKAQFNLNMLPRSSHLHAKQFNETVSHSGYLTFASKRP